MLLFLCQVPLSLLQNLKIFTASAVAIAWKTLALPVSSSDVHVTLLGFPMVVTLECTALNYFLLFFAGVLAYPSHSFFYKAAGLLFGTICIFFMNVFRIGIVGIAGHYSSSLFDFVHLYLWQGTFALLVLLLWILWVNGRSGISRILMRYILLSVLIASVSFWCMITFMCYYASLLASAASEVSFLLSGVLGVDFGSIREGIDIGYVSQNGVIYYRVWTDVMSSVLFFTLVTVTASPKQLGVFLMRICAGTLLLFHQHLLYVVMYGVILMKGIDPDTFSILLWFMHGLSLVTPVLIWLIVKQLFSTMSKHQPAQQP